MFSALRRIWNPAVYQGGSSDKRYFEGWYFKQTTADGRLVFAVIPGVSYSADGSLNHAFVQVLTSSGRTHYFTYPIESFSFESQSSFNVRIGDSLFTEEGMTLHLKDDVAMVDGEIVFSAWKPWPVTPFSPGIMGWYRFVPGMECYHGVLSLDHPIAGSVVFDGMTIDFTGGRGYIEKDWGRSFPSSWVWAQSNHFGQEGVSLLISVAQIPWMGKSFVGSIAGLLLDGNLHRFTTYTGAKLASLHTEGNEAHVVLRDKREELTIAIHGRQALVLKAPTLGLMEGHAAESLGGTIEVTLCDLRGGQPRVLFQNTGTLAGVEVMNDQNELNARK